MHVPSVARGCLKLSPSIPSSAAASFIQLSPKRAYYQSAAPIFDFLAPRLQYSNARAQSRTHKLARSNGNEAEFGRRSFTTTCRRLETRAVLHAAKDDDGNDMHLDITPRAAKRLKEIMTKDSNPNLALRIQVESGGCHGFQYLLSLSTIPPLPTTVVSPTPINHNLEDTAQLDDEDVVFEESESNAKVVIDVPSLELLKGSKVEFTTGLIGSQFTVVNPNSSSNCGCGTSFDIKF